MKTAKRIGEIVSNGLCIGCGLCEALTNGRVKMKMTQNGSLRPTPLANMTAKEAKTILNCCPGVRVEPKHQNQPHDDLIWGNYDSMQLSWAKDPDIRFRAATGGVLTALGVHLLIQQEIQFVLHVKADEHQPLHNQWCISETPDAVVAGSGSRYAPTAPLAGLLIALERNQPFAVIAKPCDLSAIHNYAKCDPRIDALCLYRLALVCGGQSRLNKSKALLAEAGIAEQDLALLRYRGHGNPGKTRVESTSGAVLEKTYAQVWEDESGWDIETRCKFCPDALGEAADIAAADVWPNALPTGEDEGFNGIVVRSNKGKSLIESAVNSQDLVLGASISVMQFNDYQPHQIHKKQNLLARFKGLEKADRPVIQTQMRLEQIAQTVDKCTFDAEVAATYQRAQANRFKE